MLPPRQFHLGASKLKGPILRSYAIILGSRVQSLEFRV